MLTPLQFDAGVEAAAEFAEASEIEDAFNKSFEDDVEYQRAELVEEDLLWPTVVLEVSPAWPSVLLAAS